MHCIGWCASLPSKWPMTTRSLPRRGPRWSGSGSSSSACNARSLDGGPNGSMAISLLWDWKTYAPIESPVGYLGIKVDDAPAISEQVEIRANWTGSGLSDGSMTGCQPCRLSWTRPGELPTCAKCGKINKMTPIGRPTWCAGAVVQDSGSTTCDPHATTVVNCLVRLTR